MKTHPQVIKTCQCFFTTLLIIQTIHQGIVCNNCNLKETYEECIEEDPLCAWCSQQNFTGNGAQRCDVLSILEKTCKKADITAPAGSIKLITDLNLSDKGAKESEAIQIKPQEIRIRLKPNSIQKFNVEYRQAFNYPIDLYYLMDLSSSMADDKQEMVELGNKLAEDMKTITSNFQLGFGSFVDKTVLPFFLSIPEMMEVYAPAYSFQNHMPLTTNTWKFAKEVKKADISWNVEDPEGGFDALMQVVVCKDVIGWRNKSRKLLVFATDNTFHYAGDGKLGGIVAPNDEKCHLDDEGYYTMGDEQDYPSIGQLNRQISNHKINIIFAVTSNFVSLYQKLSLRLKGSSTGKLEQDSSNIVDLIRQQYDAITSSVEMNDDVKNSNIKLSYYSSCLGGEKIQTQVCKELKVGQNVTFEVNLEYSKCPENSQERNRTFRIFPVGLQDHLTVHLEMICTPECKKTWLEELLSPKCNGTSECDDQQMAKEECECDETEPSIDVNACFSGKDPRPCSGAGKCRCGRCYCDTPSNPNEKVYGNYCECNNFRCDKVKGEICSGPDHGVCDCGKCKCLQGWAGDDCSCTRTDETCIGTNGEVCSGHGTCVCGYCHCGKGYVGTSCNDCPTCPGICDELKDCTRCFVETLNTNCSACSHVSVFPMEDIEVQHEHILFVDGKQKHCSFEEDKTKCRITFKYAFDGDNKVIVWVKKNRECPAPVDVIAIVSGVSGGVVATGLFLLMLWKGMTVIHDRREWAKFEKERLVAKWSRDQNPLYKEVETSYENPVYGGATTQFVELEEHR